MASNNRDAQDNQHARKLRNVLRTASLSAALSDDGGRAAGSSIHARLLGSASGVALSVASVVVALGVCVPGAAQAQTTVNPVQTTTFTLNAAQNPIIFGSTTSIDTSATPAADAIFGGGGTAWIVTNQVNILGNRRGVSLGGAGSSLVNSGTISETTNLVGSAGVFLTNGGTVTNLASGTISGSAGIQIDGARGSVVNAGTISVTTTLGTGIHLVQNGDVTNQAGGTITGKNFGILVSGLPNGTVTNAGSIAATFTTSIGVAGQVGSLTNETGGTISGVTGGVDLSALNVTVINQRDATISGGVNGISVKGP
jgi:fibronectin-binding autotransporter adhesin